MDRLDKKIGEVFELLIDNRGTTGLSIMYSMDKNDIVSIEGPKFLKTENAKPGDTNKISFKVTTLKTGGVKILFYETQIWNKNFQPLQVLEMIINVSK
jgi:hypothetical protein